MANIHAYLRDLESRLAPSLDPQTLQERLTEAEVHLRDRAQEFEEIGLPPLEAEARAVAAFGNPEEYTEDVAATPIPVAAPQTPRTRPASGLRPVGLILTVGFTVAWLLGSLQMVGATTLLAGISFAVAAARGRAYSLRAIALTGALASVALFGLLFFRFVPGRNNEAPVRPAFSAQGGLAYRRLTEFDAGWERLQNGQSPPRATWDQMTQAGLVSKDGIVLSSLLGPFAAPNLDASSTQYGIYNDPQEAIQMWRQNGRFMRRLLLIDALQGGYVEECDPTGGFRRTAFAPLAVAYFVLFLAMATLARGIGGGLRDGAKRFRRAVRSSGLSSARPVDG